MSAFTLIEGDVTLRSSGIETAVSDGIPLPIGTKGYISVGFDGTNTRYVRVDGTGRLIIVGPDSPGASASGNPVVAAGIDIGGFVRQIFTDSSGRQRIVGAADNATPVTGAPVLVGGSDGTNVYRLLTDSAGRLQVVTTGSGGTSSTFGAAFPATGTAAGYFDGTNMQGARVFDLDTGVGTEWDIGVSLRLPAPGGSITAVGQQTMANSIPVVLASDQTSIVTVDLSEEQSILGFSADHDPTSGIQTANYTNNTAPANATLSNTVAGYTTLGGLFQFAAPAGAETDYALFVYQVPVGYNLIVNSVSINSFIFGNQSTTTPTILQWALAANSNAVSLATAGPTPPIRTAIGMQQAPKSASLGDSFTPGTLVFTPKTPVVVLPTRYFHIILRVPLGHATPNQTIRGTVSIEGFFVP